MRRVWPLLRREYRRPQRFPEIRREVLCAALFNNYDSPFREIDAKDVELGFLERMTYDVDY
jgi:hypothetical protein